MLFTQEYRTGSEAKKRFYAVVELVYTAIDFSAAVCFIVGSLMFLYDDWLTVGTWFFIVGSVFFAFKPMIRLGR